MKVLIIIAPNNFRDEELFHTKEELEKAGAETVVASTTRKEVTGMLGGKAKPEALLKEVNSNEFDGVVFVGGIGSSVYFEDKKALEIAKNFFKEGKVVSAICIAPSILANAGILQGKKATCYPSEQGNLKTKKAEYTGKPVTAEGKIITASGPAAAREFGRKIAEALGL